MASKCFKKSLRTASRTTRKSWTPPLLLRRFYLWSILGVGPSSPLGHHFSTFHSIVCRGAPHIEFSTFYIILHVSTHFAAAWLMSIIWGDSYPWTRLRCQLHAIGESLQSAVYRRFQRAQLRSSWDSLARLGLAGREWMLRLPRHQLVSECRTECICHYLSFGFIPLLFFYF